MNEQIGLWSKVMASNIHGAKKKNVIGLFPVSRPVMLFK